MSTICIIYLQMSQATQFFNFLKKLIYRQHLRSLLKHVSANNWNYTEYIPVVLHYLTNNDAGVSLP
jgi:hypothetical protein